MFTACPDLRRLQLECCWWGDIQIPTQAGVIREADIEGAGCWRNPATQVIDSLETDSDATISSVRLWTVMPRVFALAADAIENDHAPLAEKLRRASPHWMRHTHATHAPGRGPELTTVRDNLRHASVSTTSIYLHSDEFKRPRQIAEAFIKAK